MVHLASDNPLDLSIERAVKYYSSLFILPSHRKIVLFTFLLCLVGGALTVFLIAQAPLFLTLQFCLFLFLLSTVSDSVIRQVFLKTDSVYNTRRCAALSMFSILLWFGFLLIGSLLTRFLSWSFWIYLFSIGFVAVCILRLIVFASTSFTKYWRILCASLTHPIFCLYSMFFVSFSMGYTFSNGIIAYFFICIPLAVFSAFIFIRSVDNTGVETLQISTTTILKAFLSNWMENLNAPIERLFENFGKERAIDFSLLTFAVENSVKSMMVVASFHPGPFRNVGSSVLPLLIQNSLEEKLDCIVAVPHGLFGHEYDLSSQRQNQKVLTSIVNSTDFTKFSSKATHFVRAQKDIASVSCQIFGDCGVFTLTLAPETTEDFPRELGDFILKEASKLGLKHVITINAHNSINTPFNVNNAIESLKEAALEALLEALKLKTYPYQIGVAKIIPKDLSLEQGMGHGGIVVLIIRVGEQICAYIIIDGNNLVSGLRERIFTALEELGIDVGEVLTTDTHEVNAIITTERGYHPLGEAIPHEKLINYIKAAAREALKILKPASSTWHTGGVPNVIVIGENQIEEMTFLADKALKQARRTALPLFTAVGLFLVVLPFFLGFI